MSFYLFINGSPLFCQLPTMQTYCYAPSPAPLSPPEPPTSASIAATGEAGGPGTCGSGWWTGTGEGGRVKRGRRRNAGKELESAKKNSESNIVNQLYSFFNSGEKSEAVVERAVRALGRD